MRSDHRTSILTIDLDGIALNWRILSSQHSKGLVGAVVKANAFGLGASFVAPALYHAGCRYFFVASLDESIRLRQAIPNGTIISLDGVRPGAEAEYAEHSIVPTLNTIADIKHWSSYCRMKELRLPAIVHIDTGLNRLGLDKRDLSTLISGPDLLSELNIIFIMTHLISAEILDDPMNLQQLDEFALFCNRYPRVPVSIANSSGIFLGPKFFSDLARPGAALYGINPTPARPNPMANVVLLEAMVLQVRDLKRGETVGYNGSWTADRPTRVATAAIGYADGLSRQLSNAGFVQFNGSRLPMIGKVSMDLTTFDATSQPTLHAGSWVEVIGASLRPDELGQLSQTNAHEILTTLGTRHARNYLGTILTAQQ